MQRASNFHGNITGHNVVPSQYAAAGGTVNNNFGYPPRHGTLLLPCCRREYTNFRYTDGEGKDDRYLEALGENDPRIDKTRIEQRKGGLLAESYRWILNHRDFQRWRDDRQSRLLWIKGDPGKGKTMLLCGIVNELNPTTKLVDPQADSVLSYFFCQATDSRINNAQAVLRGLIFLLVKQQRHLLRHVQEYCLNTQKLTLDDENAWAMLCNIFTSILGDPNLMGTFLIIDALDECVAGLDQLLKFVLQHTSSPHVKWIMSSRNWPDIKEHLETAVQKVTLCLELNEKSISAAVNAYIRHQVEGLARRKNYNAGTRGAVEQHLSLNADDTFLWVALVCQNLEKIDRRQVSAALKASPPGLDPLYERMMERIGQLPGVDLYYQILAVVTLVYRPITLAELGSLVKLLEDPLTDAELLPRGYRPLRLPSSIYEMATSLSSISRQRITWRRITTRFSQLGLHRDT